MKAPAADHPLLVGTFPIGALARLGLARAYALEAGIDLSGDAKAGGRAGTAAGKASHATPQDSLAKARSAYQELFTLWRNADPDIPILKQGRAEYAKLR